MGHKEEPTRDGGSSTVYKFSYITLWSLMSHMRVNEWRSTAFDQGLPNTVAKLIIIKKVLKGLIGNVFNKHFLL